MREKGSKPMNQEGRLTVGILIFDDVEVLDFCGHLRCLPQPAQ